MPKPRPSRAWPFGEALGVSVLVEIGKGQISERYIVAGSTSPAGVTLGKQITINPVAETAGTLLHEILHRLKPQWGERQVSNITTALMRRFTDAQIREIHRMYDTLKTTNRKAKIVKR